MTLDDALLAAIETLAALNEVWPLRDQVESRGEDGEGGWIDRRLITRGADGRPGQPRRRIPGRVLDELVARGLATSWKRPDGEAIVLTVGAAGLLGLVPDEHWAYRKPTPQEKAQAAAPGRVAFGNPRWTTGIADEGGRIPRKVAVKMEAGIVERERPVTPPDHAEEGLPEFLLTRPKEKKRGVKVYKVAEDADGVTDGMTEDPSMAAVLLGVPVEIDLKSNGSRNRFVDMARRAMKDAANGNGKAKGRKRSKAG